MYKTIYSLEFILVIFLVKFFHGNCFNLSLYTDYSNLVNLKTNLMKDYDTGLKPPNGVIVKMMIDIHNLVDLLEKDQNIVLKFWISQTWTDDRFIWDPNDYGNITSIFLPSEQTWM